MGFPGKGAVLQDKVTNRGLGSYGTAAKSLQLCLTLCDPIDGSLPGSPVPGILQARTREWVAISFSNGETNNWRLWGPRSSEKGGIENTNWFPFQDTGWILNRAQDQAEGLWKTRQIFHQPQDTDVDRFRTHQVHQSLKYETLEAYTQEQRWTGGKWELTRVLPSSASEERVNLFWRKIIYRDYIYFTGNTWRSIKCF